MVNPEDFVSIKDRPISHDDDFQAVTCVNAEGDVIHAYCLGGKLLNVFTNEEVECEYYLIQVFPTLEEIEAAYAKRYELAAISDNETKGL